VNDRVLCEQARHGIVRDDAWAGFCEDVLDDGVADDLADVDLGQPGGRRNVCKRGLGAGGESVREAETRDGLLAEELIVLCVSRE
jgi:hypothetical protein